MRLPWSIYTFVIVSAIIAYGYQFPSENNLVEVPPILSMLNPELYTNDFYVQENLQFSPRYYYQYLIYFTVKLGISLPHTYFLYYFLAFSSFTLALYALGKKIGGSQLSASTLAFLGLATTNGTIGFVNLFRTEPIPAIFAMGLAIWGIYFCFCQKWILGYLFFGLTCLVQFLVGLLPGAMFAPLLILDFRRHNNIWRIVLPLLILGGFACLVYIPMVITGNTGTQGLDNAEFVYLYGHIRHPHHLIPSYWSQRHWKDFFFFMVGGLLSIKSADSLSSKDKFNLSFVIYTSLLALLLGYIFVEVFPLSLFAKLQLARTTPFAQLMVLITLSILVKEFYQRKNIVLSLIILFAPLFDNGGSTLFILAALLATNRLRRIKSRELTVIAAVGTIMLLILEPTASVKNLLRQIFWKLALFFTLFFPFIWEEFLSRIRRIKMIIYTLALGSIIFLILGLLGALPGKLITSFQDRVKIYNVSNSSVTKLALRFRQQSSEKALVLVPPLLYQFRFYSQRSIIYDFKSFPYTDRGIREWATRMEITLGSLSPPFSFGKLDSLYSNRSGAELVEVARRFGADYLLTRTDWHSDIDGTILDREEKWVIYQINQAKIKKLVDGGNR